ncbi:MAG TPA: hypothetical protein VNW53_09220 [Phenylobacterium sp.]|jgi:hypothetical protein|nr:hypothetical protein [Phenylobacterium sp.]HXA39168.1 hypothetical protein [Phenylobacterium sp.]
MSKTQTPRKSPASPWAVALLILSSGFAAVSLALCTTGYSPA